MGFVFTTARLCRLFLFTLFMFGALIAPSQAYALTISDESAITQQSSVTAATREAGCSKKLPFDYCCHFDRGDCGGYVLVLVQSTSVSFEVPRSPRILIPTSGNGLDPPTVLRPPRS